MWAVLGPGSSLGSWAGDLWADPRGRSGRMASYHLPWAVGGEVWGRSLFPLIPTLTLLSPGPQVTHLSNPLDALASAFMSAKWE